MCNFCYFFFISFSLNDNINGWNRFHNLIVELMKLSWTICVFPKLRKCLIDEGYYDHFVDLTICTIIVVMMKAFVDMVIYFQRYAWIHVTTNISIEHKLIDPLFWYRKYAQDGLEKVFCVNGRFIITRDWALGYLIKGRFTNIGGKPGNMNINSFLNKIIDV